MSAAPTPRQAEALLMLYRGRSIGERDRELAGMSYRSYSSSMGGATARMRERMGEAGWLVERETAMGRHYYTDKLTSSGLEALRAALPNHDLDGYDARLTALRDAEAEMRLAERREEEEARARIAERAIVREAARAAAFREIMQKYQVRIDLTDEQCRAIWMEIAERELDL